MNPARAARAVRSRHALERPPPNERQMPPVKRWAGLETRPSWVTCDPIAERSYLRSACVSVCFDRHVAHRSGQKATKHPEGTRQTGTNPVCTMRALRSLADGEYPLATWRFDAIGTPSLRRSPPRLRAPHCSPVAAHRRLHFNGSLLPAATHWLRPDGRIEGGTGTCKRINRNGSIQGHDRGRI